LQSTCQALSLIWTEGELENVDKISSELKKLYDILISFPQIDHILGSGLADYVFLPLSYLWQNVLKWNDLLKERLLQCTIILIRIGWGTQMTEALFQQFLILLTTFIQPRSIPKDVPEDLRLHGFNGLEILFECEKKRQQIHKISIINVKTWIPAIGYNISILLDIYKQTECITLQNKCMSVLITFLFDIIQNESLLCRFLPGILSSICQSLAKNRLRNSQVIIKSIDLCEKLIITCLSDDQTFIDTQGAPLDTQIDSKHNEYLQTDMSMSLNTLEISSKEWLLNTREQMSIVCTIILKLKTHTNQHVRYKILQFAVKMIQCCFKRLSNCTKLVLSAILFLTGDLETTVQDASVKYLFQLAEKQTHASEFWDTMDLLLKEYLNSWPGLSLLSDEDAKRRNLVAMMHIMSLLSKRHTELGFISDFLINGISDSLHFVMDTKISDNTYLNQSILYLQTEDPFDQHIHSGQVFPVFHFKNIENNLTFLALEKMFILPRKYPIIEFLNHLLYKMKISIYEPRSNVLKWIFLCNLRDTIAHYDSCVQLDQNLDLNIRNICMDIYNDSLNYILEFSSVSYDESIDWNISQNKIVQICLDLEIIALIARKFGKGFRIELVDCLYPIVYLLGSPYRNVTNHARVCLNNLAIYCQYDSVQELLIGNVDYLINSINLKLNTFDVMPAGPTILMILLRLIGSTVVPY
ncbi:hypothetical protein PCK2_000898, partial [Pneumocystis canis]